MASVVIARHETSTIKPCQTFEGHTHWVTGAIHLPDGQRMVTCSLDGSLREWNLKSGKQIGEDWQDGDGGVPAIALSPDGTKVVSGSEDGEVRLWDIDTGKVIATWTGHTTIACSVCWSREDVENGKTILGPIKTAHKTVFAVVYSPDTTIFATAGDDELEPKHQIKI
ncbi:hypothetical protein CY34DRAFT_8627 [Suillus luteus UH-Slu-Lm8-n1]|uniref:WD40 repeat-like protein n=1 Tax=Suillus luteus UH-Slu-Lm8-n1 TaxID=930992 RepID=A0A0D0ACP2_9AGAM|nr:hypothetical protein CY34DRAFT_8627 [Suillus luteus UH-Slu-Lm8-n1]